MKIDKLSIKFYFQFQKQKNDLNSRKYSKKSKQKSSMHEI